ncbi:MAG: hypothetical protein ACREQY_18220, partial [Candidatus Binatia bacterium]
MHGSATMAAAAGLILACAGAAKAQLGPIERGVICVMDGTMTYAESGGDVDDDYNYLDAFREDSDFPVHAPTDPLDGPAQPSARTIIDVEISGCTWLGGEELDACFPAGETLRYVIEGATVSDASCISRTFKGSFHLVDQSGAAVFGEHGPACTGAFFCGHSASEIGIDILRVLPGISDPGSVDGEANDGRGESPPFVEQCTLLTTRRERARGEPLRSRLDALRG